MFCRYCGAQVEDGAKECPVCGKEMKVFVPVDEPNSGEPIGTYVGFMDAVKLVFTRAVDFKGRSSKSEFWWGYLFLSAASMVASFIPVIGYLASLGGAFLSASLLVRRFRDAGLDWRQVFKCLIPIYGIYFMVKTCLLPSSDGLM